MENKEVKKPSKIRTIYSKSTKEDSNKKIAISEKEKLELTKTAKINNTFEILYSSVVEILKETESKKSKIKNKELNPFYRETKNTSEKIKEIVIKYIKQIEIEASTVIVAFIYLDFFLMKNLNYLCKESLEM